MTSVTHKFVSGQPDSGNTTVVQPSNWNDEHSVSFAAADIASLGFITSASASTLAASIIAAGDYVTSNTASALIAAALAPYVTSNSVSAALVPYLTSASAASVYLPLAGGTITGSITVQGSATFSGTVRFSTALEVSATLSAGIARFDTLTVSGAARALGGLDVSGTGSLGALIVAGNAAFNGTASFAGTAIFGATVTFSAFVRHLAALDVSATLSAGNAVFTNAPAVGADTLITSNSVSVMIAAAGTGGLSSNSASAMIVAALVAGDYVSSNTVSAMIAAAGTGGLSSNSASAMIAAALVPYLTSASAATVYLPLAGGTITGSITVQGSATFSGTARFSTAVEVSATLSAGIARFDTMTVSGAARALGGFDVSGTGSLGALIVAANAQFNGTASFSGTAHFAVAIVNAGTTTLSGAARALGGFDVSGTGSLGALIVAANAQFNGTASFSGTAHFAAGIVNAGTTTLSGAARALTSFDVSGTASVGLLIVAATATFAGTARFGATVTFSAVARSLAGFDVSGTASVGALIVAGNSVLLMSTSAQTFAGGAIITAQAGGTLSAGAYKPQCASRPLHYAINGGAFTWSAPDNDGVLDVLLTNGASAGAVTFAGFTVGSNVGDTMTTSLSNAYLVQIRRINSVATYTIKALQ